MTKEAVADLIQFRRQLHQYPELGYNEFNTARSIRQKLDILKIPYESGIAKTGIVAELSKGNGKCIALRADMDALPIQEETNLEFASKNKGIMHACGHDVHTTMLLGAAMKLKDSDFSGRIKFIFQPSEEGANGDAEKKSGGQRIVESGILKDVDYALGLHVNPLLEVGALSFAPGNAFAYTSNIAITILGKAGHAGAAPHLSVDAILIAGVLIQNLNTIVSRNISPTKSGVVSITMINGGNAPNVIAGSVKMRGTIRSLELPDYDLLVERISQIIKGVSESFNAKIEFTIDSFYPGVVNNPNVNDALEQTANEIFSKGLIETEPVLAGEDFGFYSRAVPSMFYFIGARDVAEPCYFLHHPKVIVNEDCIPLGINFLAKSALKLLEN